MIFQKGERIPNDIFIYNGEHIEIVKEFNYVGYVVSSGGTIQRAITMLADKAVHVRETSVLFSILRQI